MTDRSAPPAPAASDPEVLDSHRQYTRNPLLRSAQMPADPLILLRVWLMEAGSAGEVDPTAAVLATVDTDGQPSARVVLVKAIDHGLCFYTHYDSRKGRALAAEPRAAFTFWWGRLERSVRAEGAVEKMTPAEAERYFHSRPRGSQLAASASRQSSPVSGRAAMDAQLAEIALRCEGKAVPVPDDWGGYRLIPERIEFWQGQNDRFHDRLVYCRAGSGWTIHRLQP